MLTVKHIFLGIETIYPADDVAFLPADDAKSISPLEMDRFGGVVKLYLNRVEGVNMRRGTVFVMNDKGSTVAKYILSDRFSDAAAATRGETPEAKDDAMLCYLDGSAK